jgi:uncharacterized tellurite resistance protein B-like protein
MPHADAAIKPRNCEFSTASRGNPAGLPGFSIHKVTARIMPPLHLAWRAAAGAAWSDVSAEMLPGPGFRVWDHDRAVRLCAGRNSRYQGLSGRESLMSQGLLAKVRSVFEGDPGVRKVADDPTLAAELLLLFRMILADGEVSESELATFRRICRASFGISEESIDGVVAYLNDFGYETSGAQALDLFRELDPDRRKLLAQHMAEIAKADARLAESEVRLLRRTLDLLGLSPVDLVRPMG